MSQIKMKVTKGVQEQAVRLLELDNVRFEALLAFVKVGEEIEPLIMCSNDLKEKDKFLEDLYNLFNKYFDFKKIKEEGKI